MPNTDRSYIVSRPTSARGKQRSAPKTVYNAHVKSQD